MVGIVLIRSRFLCRDVHIVVMSCLGHSKAWSNVSFSSLQKGHWSVFPSISLFLIPVAPQLCMIFIVVIRRGVGIDRRAPLCACQFISWKVLSDQPYFPCRYFLSVVLLVLFCR